MPTLEATFNNFEFLTEAEKVELIFQQAVKDAKGVIKENPSHFGIGFANISESDIIYFAHREFNTIFARYGINISEANQRFFRAKYFKRYEKIFANIIKHCTKIYRESEGIEINRKKSNEIH